MSYTVSYCHSLYHDSSRKTMRTHEYKIVPGDRELSREMKKRALANFHSAMIFKSGCGERSPDVAYDYVCLKFPSGNIVERKVFPKKPP